MPSGSLTNRGLLGRSANSPTLLALQRMAKGNTRFKSRPMAGLTRLAESKRLAPVPAQSGSLFSQIPRQGAHLWLKLTDSDGLLVSRRSVRAVSAGAPENQVRLLVGIILQSEDSTSTSKPNPLGKAAIASSRNGVWVDLAELGRRRLDRLHVPMLLPSESVPQHRRRPSTQQRNVETAAALMPDGDPLFADSWLSAKELASEITRQTHGWLRGRGRPRT
jgi:hypothetical protein